MRLNETKMQILMGEQEMNIRMLAERSGVSRQTISCIKAGKAVRRWWPASWPKLWA